MSLFICLGGILFLCRRRKPHCRPEPLLVIVYFLLAHSALSEVFLCWAIFCSTHREVMFSFRPGLFICFVSRCGDALRFVFRPFPSAFVGLGHLLFVFCRIPRVRVRVVRLFVKDYFVSAESFNQICLYFVSRY